MLRRTDHSRPADETDGGDDSRSSLRIVLAKLGLFSLQMVALLVGLILALEWFAHDARPTDESAMRLLQGKPGVGTKSLRVSPDGRKLATTDTSGRVALWSADDEWRRTTLFNHGGFARTTTFSPDGRFLVGGGDRLTLWDLKNEGDDQVLPVPVKSINAIELAPDGRTLAVAPQFDGAVVLWDLEQIRIRTTLPKNSHPILSLAFSSDGKHLATGDSGDNASITVWDVGTQSHLLRLRLPLGPIKAIMFSPDGKSLATASSYERGVRLWDVRSGKLVRSFAGHRLGTNSLAFSHDGSLLATGGSDGQLRLWTVATGEPETVMDGQSIGILSVAFLSNSRSLAAAGYGDNDIRVWDLTHLGGAYKTWRPRPLSATLFAFISATMSSYPQELPH